MKILVTGGAGYIGAHATYELIKQGHQVVIIDSLWRGHEANIHPEAVFYKFDLREVKKLEKVIASKGPFDGIMHFAGSIIVSESMTNPLDYYSNNVTSLEILLRIANKFAIKNIVFSSTAAVYAHGTPCPIKEGANTNPLSPYGASKLMAEMLLHSWGSAAQANYMIFRYFNVAGAHPNRKIGIRGKNLTHILPSILETVLGKRKVFKIYGSDYGTKDGTCVRDYIHVTDLVQAHILGLKWIMDHNKSEIINLGSGSGYTVCEVLEQAKQVLHTKVNAEFGNRRSGDSEEMYADIAKARHLLKWSPQIKLGEIIKSDYEFRKKHITTS